MTDAEIDRLRALVGAAMPGALHCGPDLNNSHCAWRGDVPVAGFISPYDAGLYVAAVNALPSLLDEVERLRADAARLDHIEKHARYDPKIDGNHAWWPTTFENVLRGPTLRAAIDAAMGGEKRE